MPGEPLPQTDHGYHRKGGMTMSEFTHFDDKGNAYMVDVSDKEVTRRSAAAQGKISVSRDVMDAVLGKKTKKGDVSFLGDLTNIPWVEYNGEIEEGLRCFEVCDLFPIVDTRTVTAVKQSVLKVDRIDSAFSIIDALHEDYKEQIQRMREEENRIKKELTSLKSSQSGLRRRKKSCNDNNGDCVSRGIKLCEERLSVIEKIVEMWDKDMLLLIIKLIDNSEEFEKCRKQAGVGKRLFLASNFSIPVPYIDFYELKTRKENR